MRTKQFSSKQFQREMLIPSDLALLQATDIVASCGNRSLFLKWNAENHPPDRGNVRSRMSWSGSQRARGGERSCAEVVTGPYISSARYGSLQCDSLLVVGDLTWQ